MSKRARMLEILLKALKSMHHGFLKLLLFVASARGMKYHHINSIHLVAAYVLRQLEMAHHAPIIALRSRQHQRNEPVYRGGCRL